MWCFDSLLLVVSTSAINSLERLISKMTYYVSCVMLNPTHSFTLISQLQIHANILLCCRLSDCMFVCLSVYVSVCFYVSVCLCGQMLL